MPAHRTLINISIGATQKAFKTQNVTTTRRYIANIARFITNGTVFSQATILYAITKCLIGALEFDQQVLALLVDGARLCVLVYQLYASQYVLFVPDNAIYRLDHSLVVYQ